MSYEAAVAQVDQILQWQQQIANPAAATQTAATGGAGLTAAAGGGGATAFADALAQAQSATAAAATGTSTGATTGAGLLGGGDSQLVSLLSSLQGSGGSASGLAAAGLSGTAVDGSGLAGSGLAGAAPATSAADPRVTAMVQEANALVGKPYVWGGGHGGWGPQAGYDCSGFVSAVLHAGGYLSAPQDTTTLPSAVGIEPGPGRYVTIYDRSQPGENGHVIIEIDGQFYESGGQSGTWGGGGGVERIATPSAAYLSTFDTILHPAGL